MAVAAQDNVGAAAKIASDLGGLTGETLQKAANIAFMDASSIALLAGAAAAFGGALLLLRFMPAKDLQTADET